MTLSRSRTNHGLLLCAVILLAPFAAQAQTHAHGSAWIHREAMQGTLLHAANDTACVLEFPDDCLGGGMMGPDSVYCEFTRTPSDEAPFDCLVVVHCEILDDDGTDMMPGHHSQHGLFRRQLQLTLAYDPTVVASLGIDPSDLVVTTWNGETVAVVEDVTHDPVAHVFHLTTSELDSWYGIADAAAVPLAVETAAWGAIKELYR